MARVNVFITNGPAGSGKDAISAAVQNSLKNHKTAGTPDDNIIISFKKALFQYTANFFNINLNDFYQDKDGGFYDRKNKELPNSNLKLEPENISKISDFYNNTNKILDVDNDIFGILNKIPKIIEEFKAKYNITSDNLSPRNALIFTSECLIKPMYGSDFFGDVVAKEIENIHNENKDSKKQINIYITDSGFADELKALSNLSKKLDVNPIILSIYRPGYDYDASKDSRVRLTDKILKDAGIENIPTVKIMNNTDLNTVMENTISKVLDFQKGIIIPDSNMATIDYYSLNAKYDLNSLSNFFKILNNNKVNNFIIQDVNITDYFLSIKIAKDNGSIFKSSEIDQLNIICNMYSSNSHGINKNQLNVSFDEDLKISSSLSKNGFIKNYMENASALQKVSIQGENIGTKINEFLNLKGKNDNLLKVFNKLLLENVNNLMKKDLSLIEKLNLTQLKSLKTACETINENLNNIESSDIIRGTKKQILVLNSTDPSKLYEFMNGFNKMNPLEFKILSDKNLINVFRTKEGFEIEVENMPLSKLKNLNGLEGIHQTKSNLGINPTFGKEQVKKANGILNEIKEYKSNDTMYRLTSTSLKNNLQKFCENPSITNFVSVDISANKLNEIISKTPTNENDAKKIYCFIKQLNEFKESEIPKIFFKDISKEKGLAKKDNIEMLIK